MPILWNIKAWKPWICSLHQRWKLIYQTNLKVRPEFASCASLSVGHCPSALAYHGSSPIPPLFQLKASLASGSLIPGGSGLTLDFRQFFWHPNFLITCADTILISFNMSFIHSWEMYVCSGICPQLPLWKERREGGKSLLICFKQCLHVLSINYLCQLLETPLALVWPLVPFVLEKCLIIYLSLSRNLLSIPHLRFLIMLLHFLNFVL